MSHLEQFLSALSSELPDICCDKDLVNLLPNIFKNHCALTRMRSRGQTPAYFSISPNIYYLKQDVISWLKLSYKENGLEECAGSENKPLEYVESQIENLLRWKGCVDIAINDINNRIES